MCANVWPQGLLVLGLPAPVVPHSASLGPAIATRVLSTPVPVSALPTGLDECLFFIYLVSDPLAVRFSVSSGCARRRSVSTYAAILVLLQILLEPFVLLLGHCQLCVSTSTTEDSRLITLPYKRNIWPCPQRLLNCRGNTVVSHDSLMMQFLSPSFLSYAY